MKYTGHFEGDNFALKKMFLTKMKERCTVGNREMGFWPGKKAENALI